MSSLGYRIEKNCVETVKVSRIEETNEASIRAKGEQINEQNF